MAANLVLVLFTLLVAAAVLAIRAYFRAPPALYARRSVPDLIVGNGLILLGLSTVALLGGEIYYRFLHDTTDAFGLARVTQDWMLRHERMNRFGFRDDLEYAPDRAPGKRRVAFVGDSFTAGHGVEDVNLRFANRIRAAHPEWEVHVLANNGLDTGAELDLLRRLAGSRYEFDLVVLVYCLNDVADLLPKWAEVQGRLYSRERPAAIVDHSYLLNTFNARRIAASDTGGYYDFVLDGYSGATWEEQQRRLAAMAGLVRDLGGRFALVTFPFLSGLEGEYGPKEAHARIAEFCRAHDVPSLDLLATFAGRRSEDLVVNARDPHPNPAAHALAADAIGPFVAGLFAAPAK